MPGEGCLTITVLGSGTSVGVPTIGCHCPVCSSSDPRDHRLRPSVLVSYSGRNVVVDTTPDFRQQMLRARVERLDAVLVTHAHADHIMGLDDVRPFNYRQKHGIPVYGSPETIATLRRVFEYIFTDRAHESHVPRLETVALDGAAFDLFGVPFTPLPLKHGRTPVYGYRFGSAAYLTDHSEIPPESAAQLRDLDVLFLDALRDRPHPTHTTVERALQHVLELKPRRAFFTHICHDLSHEETERRLPENVRLAYDGLEVQVPLPHA